MEQHADKDHLEESFPRDEYLESQEESFSTPAVSHTRPPPTSHDTIQDSTSSPRDFYTMHQVHYRKPMLAFGKISKTKDNEGSPLEDLPDADALQTWSKNSKASKETKRKVLAQQASRPPQPGSDSDDSDGLEIVRDAPAKHLPVAGPSRAGSKPPRPPSAMHRKSSGSGRPQLDFTDSQFREAGQKWGSGGSSSHNRKGKQVQRNHVGKDGLNSTLLRRSHEQGRANADKRRAEWHARGGRERKDQKAQEVSYFK